MVNSAAGSVELSERQRRVQRDVREICSGFDDAYWRDHAAAGEYPHEFVDALAAEGWLGVLVPEEYGGAGLSTTESVVMMEEIAASGGGFGAAQAVHGGVYNTVPLVNYADPETKAELLPGIAAGDISVQSLGLTEPDAGSESTAIETTATLDGDEYVVDGRKLWTSRLEVSDYLLLVARTTPREDVEKPTRGLSLLLVDLEDAAGSGALTMEPIAKTAGEFVTSFELTFDGLRVPAGNLVGVEGEGFYHVLDGLNEERLVVAAECVGLGELAVQRGAAYAREREVFGRPIGSNQAIQHPLAAAHARLQAAREFTYASARRAGDLSRRELGGRANAAKYLAAEACFDAADAAVQTHGGLGVAREYDVERYLREARLTRLVPVTQELALNYVAETVLDLPRSY